jgi:hypothetical protein
MIAFLVFLALMIAFIVGCVRISMYLHSQKWAEYLSEHQLVTLNQEASLGERSSKQRRDQPDVGMSECVQRVVGISVGIVGGIVLLTIVFFNVVV